MTRRAVHLAALLALSACAGRPGLADLDAHPLRYEVPTPNPATYTFTTSMVFSIAAGPIGTMSAGSEQSGVAELVFRSDDEGVEGVEATITILEYDGRFENPNQGTLEVDEGDITGSWTAHVDPKGRLEILGAPSFGGPAADLAGPENMVRPFFPLLPGGATEPGATWLDTVTTTERTGRTATRSQRIIRSTLAGDTVIDERWLIVIRTEAATTLEIEGSSGGVEVVQRLAGTMSGTVLWDPVDAVLFARTDGGEMEGTLELPGIGFGALPVTGTVRRTVSLRP